MVDEAPAADAPVRPRLIRAWNRAVLSVVRWAPWIGAGVGLCAVALGGGLLAIRLPHTEFGQSAVVLLGGSPLVGGALVLRGAWVVRMGRCRRGLAWLALGAALAAQPATLWAPFGIPLWTGLRKPDYPGLHAPTGARVALTLWLAVFGGFTAVWIAALLGGGRILRAEEAGRRLRIPPSGRWIRVAVLASLLAGSVWAVQLSGVADPMLAMLRSGPVAQARFWASRLGTPMTRPRAMAALFELGPDAIPSLRAAAGERPPPPGFLERAGTMLVETLNIDGGGRLWIDAGGGDSSSAAADVLLELARSDDRALHALLAVCGLPYGPGNPFTAAHRVRSLGRRAVDALGAALTAEPATDRSFPAETLGYLARDAPEVHAGGVLAEAAQSPRAWVRRAALRNLGGQGAASVPVLLNGLHDPDPDVRAAAGAALARACDRDPTARIPPSPAVIAAVWPGRGDARRWTIRGAVRPGRAPCEAPPSLAELIALLADPGCWAHAAEVAGWIGPAAEAAIPYLRGRLLVAGRRPDAGVMDALSRIDPLRALAVLGELHVAGIHDWWLAERAAAIRGVDVLPLLRVLDGRTRWWQDRNGAERLIEPLGPRARALLPSLLAGEDFLQSRHLPGTLVALGAVGSAARAALPLIQRCAQDRRNLFRGEAALAWWRITGEIEGPMRELLDLLDDHPRFGTYMACDALRRMGAAARPARAALLARRWDSISGYRSHVRAALHAIDPPPQPDR